MKIIQGALLLHVLIFTSGCSTGTPTVTPLPTNVYKEVAQVTSTKNPPTATATNPTTVTNEPTATIEPKETPIPPTPTEMPTSTPFHPLSGNGGGVIAYVSEVEGVPGIHIMNADGTDSRQLTNEFDAHPDWSADGTQIAFSTRRSDIVAIFTVDVATGQVTQLTDTERSPSHPDWSPDGNQIAIVYNPNHPGINYELYLINSNGKNFNALTDSAGYQTYAGPDWSPDGTQIVVASDLEDNFNIYRMNSDGSNIVQLTTDTADDRFPAWSPDGEHIAFETYQDGNWEIYVMNADGTDLQNVSNSPDREQWPVWSPDGRRLVFQTDRDGNWEIYSINLDGTDLQRLTNNEIKDTEPSWHQ